jgi:hypothetical protein
MPDGVDRLALGGILKDFTRQEYANDFANTTSLKSSGFRRIPEPASDCGKPLLVRWLKEIRRNQLCL